MVAVVSSSLETIVTVYGQIKIALTVMANNDENGAISRFYRYMGDKTEQFESSLLPKVYDTFPRQIVSFAQKYAILASAASVVKNILGTQPSYTSTLLSAATGLLTLKGKSIRETE